MNDWGPSHQQPHPGIGAKRTVGGVLFAAAMVSSTVFHLLIWAGLFYACVRLNRRFALLPRLRAFLAGEPAGPPASISASCPSAVYLGVGQAGWPCWSRHGRAVLVIGPSQSGKTTSVIIPTLLDYPGPIVSTSTKPDVLHATIGKRLESGRVWQFDPTGQTERVAGAQALRWSPLPCSTDWDGALLMARAMVDGAAVGAGITEANHWAKRAQALLAALLHAAAITEAPMRTVIGWVTSHDIDDPLNRLRDVETTPLAVDVLTGVANTEARERSSIFPATADALDGYTSQAALEATEHENFDAHRFVISHDTMYIHAPAESQRLAAPLVCGLLAEIRRATYQAHASGELTGRRVLFALDEVANVAPISELPQIASEGGGQGLLLLAVLQDLSQARARWGTIADGFLTLFGTKLILPGVADPRTLETISTALGEYDRRVVTESHANVPGRWRTQRSTSQSTQRTRVLSPGEVANIPAGHALHLDGVRWKLVTLTPFHQLHSPFEAMFHAR